MSASTAPSQPRSKTDLFLSFTLLALQGFGGVLAVVQRELVDKKRWLTREQFVEEWAVAQTLPGPNVVNLALMLGGRYFGWTGALAGVAGMLAAPTVVVLVLVWALGSVADTPAAQGALRGMGAVSAGLIAAVGLKLMGALRSNPMGLWACAALALLAFVAVAWWRWPLALALLGCGGLGMAWAAHRLAAADRAEPP